jgi:hypothetical protein
MGIRRLASGLAAGAVVATGLVGLSAPAQALPSSTWQITIDCAHDVYLPGNPGDTYDFTLAGDCLSVGVSDYSYLWNEAYDDDADQYLHNGFLGVPANTGSLDYHSCSENCGVADPSDWYIYAYDVPQTAVRVQLLSTNQVGEKLTPGAIVGNVYTVLTNTGWDIYWIGAEDTPPPSWYQGVGRVSADATCDAGWTASWAQWPNGGTGGWVCNREQYYNTATAGWAYRAAKK